MTLREGKEERGIYLPGSALCQGKVILSKR